MYPGAPELDDGKDNDQDGTVDEGLDGDGDGFTPINGGDADDTDSTVYPGAAELCDGEDNDQDGTVDEGWPDTDGDAVADCIDLTQTVAFVAGNSRGAARDQPAIARLRSMGLEVTVIDDNVVSAASVAGFDLIVLSSSVVPAKVGTKLTNVAVPIVTWEGYLFDELKLTTKGGETSTAQTRVTVGESKPSGCRRPVRDREDHVDGEAVQSGCGGRSWRDRRGDNGGREGNDARR